VDLRGIEDFFDLGHVHLIRLSQNVDDESIGR
jgi:hypothetical protein